MMAVNKVDPSSNEVMAFKIVSDGLGIEVVPYDNNSKPRMVDALIPPDGALEVIGDHDSDFNSLWSKLNKSGHEIEIPTLAHGWRIGIEHSANIKNLTKALPAFLLNLEAQGITSTTEMPIRESTAGIHEQMMAFGVDIASQASTTPKGRVRFQPSGWSGFEGSDESVLADWVAMVLGQQTDVAPKLRDHLGVKERHAFNWATIGSSYAVQSYLEDDGPLPSSLLAPELPEGITHVWIAGIRSSQGVVAWFPDRGWWRTAWRWPVTERGRKIAANLAEVWSNEAKDTEPDSKPT
jgi:hypothetical protein